MKAIIIGGGIGGVTAALCLLDAGIEVELHERSPALTETGAGIQLSPNGMKVLMRLGLHPEIDHVAFRPEALEMRMGKTGARIFSIPIRELALTGYGAPYYHVHRADLMSVLSRALQKRAPSCLYLNREFVSYEQDSTRVVARFSDGSEVSGDILIGADGIHSAVRAVRQGRTPARFTGNVAWRLVVPATDRLHSLVPPNATIWVGPGRHAVTYYLRRGELINFVGVVERDDWQKESWTEEGDVAQLRADYAGWATPVAEVVAQATSCFRWALFDRNPLDHWCDGRVALLGDACHPMLPFLAQGAVMAIEDSWVLSRTLRSAQEDLAADLAAYEALRKPRTSRVQLGARRQMGLYHQRTTFNQVATYGPMWLAANLMPGFVNSRQDWLYAFDVTSDQSPTSVSGSEASEE
ncbi:MAG: FAD-dependent monooxygenase [Micropepsaceae bacterium]